ncbi:hypothetical protein RZN05_09640 [Sphingomonas sp. HF-S4]|uniref:Secreted protein n=1 Tax=Sphingomonas agrestis TaxID=3080540 RepID=A0ABU3Y7I6_9SPHN|nr:hypothetical protein [Sphingomonas sp. HF-S4]MDV3457244.1 hypothetical protein [Sphingomonas sp. HF-S4]
MISTRTTGRVSSFAAAMIAAAVLVAGATAPAQASDQTVGAGSAVTAKVEKPKRYCVKPQATTGTILARKTCMTREEWVAKTGQDPVVEQK